MKKLIVICLTTIMLFSVQTYADEYEAPEELQKRVEAKDAGDYIEGSVLSHEDFYLYTNDESFAPYNYNILDCILSEEGVGGFRVIYPLGDLDEEYGLEGQEISYITFRGIDLADYESTREQVIEKYGAGVDGRFDQTTDELYQTMDSFGANEASLLFDRACSYLLYTYEDLGQIKFYFNTKNELIFTAFISGTDHLYAEKPCIKEVQRYLNKIGYELGKPDGIVGSKTSAAITSYKESHGLSVNGRVDDELIKCIYAEQETSEESKKETDSQFETEAVVSEDAEIETEIVETQVQERNPYRTDISYEELMRNPNDHYGELYSFSGTVLQLFDSIRIRVALNGNSDEQLVCSYGWLSMPSDLVEGDTVTIYGSFEGKEKYTSVLGVDTEFPEFICYKMETPGGTATPWASQQIKSVKRAEEKALSGE